MANLTADERVHSMDVTNCWDVGMDVETCLELNLVQTLWLEVKIR